MSVGVGSLSQLSILTYADGFKKTSVTCQTKKAYNFVGEFRGRPRSEPFFSWPSRRSRFARRLTGVCKKNLLRAKEEEREVTQEVVSTSDCLSAIKLVNHVDNLSKTKTQELLLPKNPHNSEIQIEPKTCARNNAYATASSTFLIHPPHLRCQLSMSLEVSLTRTPREYLMLNDLSVRFWL